MRNGKCGRDHGKGRPDPVWGAVGVPEFQDRLERLVLRVSDLDRVIDAALAAVRESVVQTEKEYGRNLRVLGH